MRTAPRVSCYLGRVPSKARPDLVSVLGLFVVPDSLDFFFRNVGGISTVSVSEEEDYLPLLSAVMRYLDGDQKVNLDPTLIGAQGSDLFNVTFPIESTDFVSCPLLRLLPRLVTRSRMSARKENYHRCLTKPPSASPSRDHIDLTLSPPPLASTHLMESVYLPLTPTAPKVKMSSKDFTARKKKLREDNPQKDENIRSASPAMANTSATAIYPDLRALYCFLLCVIQRSSY